MADAQRKSRSSPVPTPGEVGSLAYFQLTFLSTINRVCPEVQTALKALPLNPASMDLDEMGAINRLMVRLKSMPHPQLPVGPVYPSEWNDYDDHATWPVVEPLLQWAETFNINLPWVVAAGWSSLIRGGHRLVDTLSDGGRGSAFRISMTIEPFDRFQEKEYDFRTRVAEAIDEIRRWAKKQIVTDTGRPPRKDWLEYLALWQCRELSLSEISEHLSPGAVDSLHVDTIRKGIHSAAELLRFEHALRHQSTGRPKKPNPE